MKKNHPPHHPNSEELYARVKKPARAQHPRYTEETFQTNINMGEPSSRSQREEIIYENVGTRSAATPLTKDYIAAHLLSNVDVQASAKEVLEWSSLVYGNQYALNAQLAKIHENPQAAEYIFWMVATNPKSIGPFAGRNVCGIKNRERLDAEESVACLLGALEKHVRVTQKAHKNLVREHEKHYGHQRGESLEKQLEHRAFHHAKEQKQTAQERSMQQHRHNPQKRMALTL